MSYSLTRAADEELRASSAVEGSYNICSFAADIDREVERLNAQVDLFWNQELALYQRLGVRDGMRLLDCGCGSGYLLKKLQEVFPGIECTGIEIEETLVALAKKIMTGNGCQILQQPITALGFPDHSYDFVISRLVLEHLPEPLEALKEVLRVLKVGCRAVFVDNDFDLYERTWPDSPALGDLYDAYRRARRADGGNPCIGRQLPSLMKMAGFTGVDLHVLAAHNQVVGDRVFLKAEGAGIASQLVKTGYLAADTLDAVTGQWHSMLTSPDHAIFRMLFAVVGEKPAAPDDSRIMATQTSLTGNGDEVGTGKGSGGADLRSREQIQRFMQEILADELKVLADSIPADDSLIHSGIDSMAALTLCNAVEARLGIELTIAEVLGGSSIDDLTQKIALAKNGA
jgi:ubiquinone/menaquinone biosynthesis C-methylase UbiE/acyl carrier protein